MNTYVQTASTFFLGLTTALIATLLLLALLPTHDDERHTAIKISMIPFVSGDLSFLEENERSHMQDVKVLIYILLLVFVISLLTAYYHGLHRYGAYGLLLFLAFCSGIALRGFGNFWEKFHLVLFPQGNWQFPPTSNLIQLYPESYFLAASLLFAAILIIITGFLLDKRVREKFPRRRVMVRLL